MPHSSTLLTSVPAGPGSAARPRPARGAVDLNALAGRDPRAWTALVRRFDPVIRRVARRFRLSPAQIDDVAQTTWLRFVPHAAHLRSAEAVGAWLLTTARRESLRVLQRDTRELLSDAPLAGDQPDPRAGAPVEALIAAEWRAALQAGVAALPARERVLLERLFAEPARPYAEIAAELALPVGSIGPTRARALARLRRHPRVAAMAHEHVFPSALTGLITQSRPD
jgi:RNA polymerase sigma factor (sigma-70 family)